MASENTDEIDAYLIEILEEAEEDVNMKMQEDFNRKFDQLSSTLPSLVDALFSKAKDYGAPDFDQTQIDFVKEMSMTMNSIVKENAVSMLNDPEIKKRREEIELIQNDLYEKLVTLTANYEGKEVNDIECALILPEVILSMEESEEVKEIKTKIEELEKEKIELAKYVASDMGSSLLNSAAASLQNNNVKCVLC